MKQCPLCGGNTGILGTLGIIRHYLCRNCGMTFLKPATKRKVKKGVIK